MASLDNAKAAIAFALMGGVAVFTQQVDGGVKICQDSACEELSAKEYQEVKAQLADKIEQDEPLSYDEYQFTVAALDHEMQKEDGIVLQNVSGPEDLKNRLTSLLYGN